MPILNPEHAYREFMVDLGPGERFPEHHIKLRPQDLSRYVFVPGSHLRGRRIAERMDDCRVVSATRGYYVYSGTYKGCFMSVCSTGMGGPQAAIAFEELAHLGADTFIRVGSAGAVQPHLGVGDVALATATLRLGGTSFAYLPGPYPAAANFELTRDLADAAHDLGIRVHTGVCAAGDAFYAPRLGDDLGLMRKAGVIAVEMETDTLFILGQYHGWRCASGFVLDGGEAKEIEDSSSEEMAIANHAKNPLFVKGEDDLITVALEAMVRRIEADRR